MENPTALSTWHRAKLLVEEYRALYTLLTFRLAAIDQRLPLVSGALLTFVASVPAIEPRSRLLALLLVPAAAVWIHRTTILHARSKEDLLRRIDEIESHLNALACEELLVFQSRHPNRNRSVSGRSGMGSVRAVLVAGLVASALAAVLFVLEVDPQRPALIAYLFYSALAASEMVRSTWLLRGYRYVKADRAGQAGPTFPMA